MYVTSLKDTRPHLMGYGLFQRTFLKTFYKSTPEWLSALSVTEHHLLLYSVHRALSFSHQLEAYSSGQ